MARRLADADSSGRLGGHKRESSVLTNTLRSTTPIQSQPTWDSHLLHGSNPLKSRIDFTNSYDHRRSYSRNQYEEDENRMAVDEQPEPTNDDTLIQLRRQVNQLQAEYDRQLHTHTASTLLAMGYLIPPPSFAAIHLYRQYKRVQRISTSLQQENERLAIQCYHLAAQHHPNGYVTSYLQSPPQFSVPPQDDDDNNAQYRTDSRIV